MTEEPSVPPSAEPHEDAPPPALPPKRGILILAWLCGAGFLVLAASLGWLCQHQPGPSDAQIAALAARLARIERQPAPQPPDLAPLAARVAALEKRTAAQPDLAPLAARVAVLEQRPAAGAAPPPDLASLPMRVGALEQRQGPDLRPIEARLAALEAKPSADAPLIARLDALSARVGALDTGQRASESELARRLDADEARLAAIERSAGQILPLAERADRIARIQVAGMALDAGEKLGALPGAPAALARFADAAPPTEAALRLAFPAAARAALAAAHPPPQGRPLLQRLWAEAQDLVTVRQGDRVLLGDPAAGVLQQARAALDAGDLAGAVGRIGGLSGEPAKAMAGWLAEARALLDARAALAAWAAHA